MEELKSLEEKYIKLKYFSNKESKLELIKEIENLFCLTNKLRKYIIFKNAEIFDNIKDFECLDKNFKTFQEIFMKEKSTIKVQILNAKKVKE